MCKDSDIQFYRTALQPKPMDCEWLMALNSFRVLEGKEKRLKHKADVEKYREASANYSETHIYLTE
jgi:hypothetical protein